MIVNHQIKVTAVNQVTFGGHVERWLDTLFEANGDAYVAAVVSDDPQSKPEKWEVAAKTPGDPLSGLTLWPAYLGLSVYASQHYHLFARPSDGSAWHPVGVPY